jgi:hypothetical protein
MKIIGGLATPTLMLKPCQGFQKGGRKESVYPSTCNFQWADQTGLIKDSSRHPLFA